MTSKVKKRLRLLFMFMAVFASLQMVWWIYLMLEQQSIITGLIGTSEAVAQEDRFSYMIFAESGFWLLIWGFGLFAVYQTIKQERKLLTAHRDFLSGITHELKTPIANIQLCLEGLKRKDLPEEKREIFIERALSATEKLHTEIQNILNLNRQTTENTKAEENFVLVDLVNICINETSDEKYSHINWQVSVPNNIELTSELQSFKIILKTLLENAAKYTSAAVKLDEIDIVPTVVVAFEEGSLYISDNGIGFEEKNKEALFSEFYRGPLAKELAIPGTGVGLSVAKQIANKLNIDLEINSPGKYQGCSARLVFDE